MFLRWETKKILPITYLVMAGQALFKISKILFVKAVPESLSSIARCVFLVLRNAVYLVLPPMIDLHPHTVETATIPSISIIDTFENIITFSFLCFFDVESGEV